MDNILNEISSKHIDRLIDGEPTSEYVIEELCELGARSLLPRDLSRIFNERGLMYRNLGADMWNSGRTGRSLQYFDFAHIDFSTSITFDPEYWRPYFNKANLYARDQQNYELSLLFYPKAAALSPSCADVFHNMGLAYASLHQY